MAFAALAPLAGCAVGPGYRAPVTGVPAAAPFANAGAAIDPAGARPANWWSLYRDPALDALVAEALAHNSDLRIAAANLERARAVLSEERAARLPTTQLTAAASRERNGQTGNRATTLYSAGAGLAYEIDLFGRVTRSIEAARADLAAIEAARDAVRVTVAAATTQAYLDACVIGRRIDVARRSLALIDESRAITRRQVALGAGSDYDLARIGVLAEQTRADVPALEGFRAQSLIDLAVLLGRPPAQVPAAAIACRAAPVLAAPLPIGDGAALLARRPDVRVAERGLAGDIARIGIATADLYPSISLGGSIAAAGRGIASATSRQGVSFGIGPLLSWFFPNIAVARARIRQAGAQAAAALARFDGTVLTALGEVERALAGYDAERRRNAALTAANTASRRAYALSGVRIRYGAISQLEQLDVQRDLVATEAALAESDAALVDDQVALFRALGGGWQDAPAIDPRPTAIVGAGKAS